MEVIYRGPYSIVYRDGDVAVKEVDVDLGLPPHNVHREVKLLRKLQHEGIVEFLGSEQKLDDVFIKMKYYQYNLHDYMMSHSKKRTVFGDTVMVAQVNQLPPDKAESIISSMVASIKFLHDNGVIHRDIKPQNFLLRHQDDVDPVLCDFSISYDTTEANPDEPSDAKYHDVCSTYYKPLELMFGLDYGFEVDVWCLGLVISVLYSTNCKCILWMEEANDFRLIDRIFSVFGTPSTNSQDDNYWPEVLSVDSFQLIKLAQRPRLATTQIFPRAQKNREIYDKMLALAPHGRPTIAEVERQLGGSEGK